MKNYLHILFFRLAFTFGLSLSLSTFCWANEKNVPSEWALVKNKKEIKVFNRDIAGSDIKELKATVVINASVKRLVDIYTDTLHCDLWLPDCKTSTLVSKESDTSFSVYIELKNPWPYQNRDYVVQSKLTENTDSGEVIIEFNKIDTALPENTCCVRMKSLKGFWKFTPSTNNYVEVTYQIHLDPGGTLKGSLINGAMPDLPFETLTKMRAAAERTQ